jgi:hypothetical protein
MRQDITFKFLKVFGITFGSMLVLALISIPIMDFRTEKLLRVNKIAPGLKTPFGIIRTIDSSSVSYQANFEIGERTCFVATVDSGRTASFSAYSSQKITNTFDCD